MQNGLPNNTVNAIAFDDSGNVWFGTNGGIAVTNGSAWRTYQWNDTITWRGEPNGVNVPSNLPPSNSIECIVFDNHGNGWFGTSNVGFFERINDTTWFHNLGFDNVHTIVIDSQNVKWIGTIIDGVWQYNDTTFIQYDKPNTGPGLADYTVTSIAFDSHGNKWFGTYNGVSKFDGVNWTTYNTNNGLLNNLIYALVFDRQWHLWVGTNGGGVAMFTANQ